MWGAMQGGGSAEVRKDLLEADARDPMPTIKNWSTTPWERRRLVCPIDVDVPALQARALRQHVIPDAQRQARKIVGIERKMEAMDRKVEMIDSKLDAVLEALLRKA